MISPTDNVNMLRDDEPRSISVEEVLKMHPKHLRTTLKFQGWWNKMLSLSIKEIHEKLKKVKLNPLI